MKHRRWSFALRRWGAHNDNWLNLKTIWQGLCHDNRTALSHGWPDRMGEGKELVPTYTWQDTPW